MSYITAFLRCVLAAAPLVAFGMQAVAAEGKSLVFGILNQQSPGLTAQRWNPILSYLAGKTGVTFTLRMGPTVEQTNAMMGRGEFDFVFTNHNFKPEYDSLGYRVVARWSSEPSHTAIVVPPDSLATRLSDLTGRRVAFPSQHAFFGYAVPLAALARANITIDKVFAGNQEGVLAQTKARRVDAGAVNSRFLAEYSEREGVRFRTLYLSEPFPDLAVVVHPRIPQAMADRTRDALVGMSADPLALPILAAADCPGFVASTDEDYNAVRSVYRRLSP